MEMRPLSSLALSLGCAGRSSPAGDRGTRSSLSQPTEPDSGAQSTPGPTGSLCGDAGSLFHDASEPACPPAPVASFTPSWKKPNASTSGACSSAQIATYYDACLGPASNTGGCAAFAANSADNQTCASCLGTNDTATQYGPVVWHDNLLFYTTNIAGCIADKQGDTSDTGCGAAYQAVVTCKQQACTTCLSAQNPDFTRYTACENEAAGECDAFIQNLDTVCGTALKDASNPIAVCIPPSADTAQDAYLRLAPIFCGQ